MEANERSFALVFVARQPRRVGPPQYTACSARHPSNSRLGTRASHVSAPAARTHPERRGTWQTKTQTQSQTQTFATVATPPAAQALAMHGPDVVSWGLGVVLNGRDKAFYLWEDSSVLGQA